MKKKLERFTDKKLPLTFKYMEFKNLIEVESTETVYYIKCSIYQTHYNTRRLPHKFLTRLL